MVGDGYGKFHPYDGLILQDATKAVVTMLNFGARAKLEGGYPFGYMKIAGELGLTKGITKSAQDKLTAAEAYILLANALNADVLQAVFEGNEIVYKQIDGENLLYKSFDCVKGEGLVSANDKTTLITKKKSETGCVTVGDTVLYAGNTDIASKLGYYVEYYAIENEFDDLVIVAYEIPENKNEMLVLKSSEILDTTTSENIDYEINNRAKSAKIAAGADIIYNGVAKQDVNKWYFMPDSGSVTLFDRDGDKYYDIIVVESYINYVLDKAPQSGYIIDKYTQGSINTEDEAFESVKIYFKGKEISLSELKEWDVLSVKADGEKFDAEGYRKIDFENTKYLEIYVTRQEISGRADSVDNVEKSITIGADDFYYSENLIQADQDSTHTFRLPVGGTQLSVMLDINGMIAAVNVTGFSEKTYGFLIKTVVDEETEPNEVYLKIFTGNEIVTYTCREKFRLDGKSGKREIWGRMLVGIPQMIAFKTNSEGKITEIDTGEFDKAYEKEETSLQFEKKYEKIKYKRNPKIFYESGTYENPQFYINGATKIYKIPSKTDILKNNYSEQDFEIITNTYFQEHTNYSIEIFNMEETKCPEILVLYVDNSVSQSPTSSARNIMVDKIEERLNEYGEVEICLNGYYNSSAVSYTFRDKKILDNYTDDSGKIKVKRGDIVSANVSESGEIYAFAMFREFTDDIDTKQTSGGSIEDSQRALGYAYSKASDVIVARIDAGVIGANEDVFSVYPCNTASKKVTLYDATVNRVSVITVADVLCETEVGNDAYLLYPRISADGSIQDVFAYKLR